MDGRTDGRTEVLRFLSPRFLSFTSTTTHSSEATCAISPLGFPLTFFLFHFFLLSFFILFYFILFIFYVSVCESERECVSGCWLLQSG